MAAPALSPAARLVRAHDPDRFLASLFAPPARRETLFTLYAFNHELARAREVASQPVLGLIRLQWWREVVDGTAKRHEIATPLAIALEEGRLSRALLLEMLAAREAEADEAMPTRDAWLGYLEGTAGALAEAAGQALTGVASPRLRSLGTAYGIAGMLRSVAVHAAAGRCLLPEEVLARHGTSRHAVVAGRDAAALRAVFADLADDARSRLRTAGGAVPRAAIAAALPAVLARRDLRRPGQGRARTLGDRVAVVAGAVLCRV